MSTAGDIIIFINCPKIRYSNCPFCGWCCSGSDAGQLDRHYWKACPFLTKCPQCSQVLEVAALNYHLTSEFYSDSKHSKIAASSTRTTAECEAKDSYVVCTRCTESVHKQLYELHQMEDFCRGTYFISVSLLFIKDMYLIYFRVENGRCSLSTLP